MKVIARAAAFVALAFSAAHLAFPSPPQETSSAKQCLQPGTLELVPSKNGEANYIIGGKTYSEYPLDELAKLLQGPGCDRPLYVLIDYRVPVGYVPSAVISKLQAENVRYFIRYPWQENVVEIKIVGYDPKLP